MLELSMFREWYIDDSLSCCPRDGRWNTRIRKCRDFLASRDEAVIAVVGHGMLFQALQEGSGASHFDNVEVRKCVLDVPAKRISAGEILYKPDVPSTWQRWEFPDDSQL